MNCRPGKEFPSNDSIGNFLNNSKKGVVLISFGSVLKDSNLSEDKRQSLLSIFKNFPEYDFIWKWTEDVKNLPKNVLKSNWLPQQDILAHPNLKVFITHVGQGSFQETLCHQKPVIAVPISGDQPVNAMEVKRLGIGIPLAINDWSEANFYDALNNVLHDPKYTEAAKTVGSAMNDQIDRPLDRAVWWVEHVM